MSNCCNCDSEINRDGSGQLGRYLKALDPAYAPIDDRSIEDLLVFTKRYANQVRFYDIPGSNPGNDENPAKISWREFFRRDMAVIAASIAVTDLDSLKKDYDEIRTTLDARPGHHLFSNLFDPIIGIVARIDKWYSIAIPENPLYEDLKLAIDSYLKNQFKTLVAYDLGFKVIDSQHPSNLNYASITNRAIWGLDENISADISIYTGVDTIAKFRNAALYVDDVFNSFYGFLKLLVEKSEGYMKFAMEQYPAHQPHMALFISFLQLFQIAQEQMNGLTEKMLDFYYRDVLQLTAKPSIADNAFIIFELAKDITEFDIAPDTVLKATPDAAGKDQLYTTITDLVVNQAKVKELKTTFIDKQIISLENGDGTSTNSNVINTVYARPVAKSPDGFGAKFIDPNPKWPTFGRGDTAISASLSACKQITQANVAERKDQAAIGFAIASPQLVMQGGKRLVSIAGLDSFLAALKQNAASLQIWLTGEKGWLAIDSLMDEIDFEKLMKFIRLDVGIFNPEADYLERSYTWSREGLSIYLPIGEQGIVPFNPAIHTGYAFDTSWPVLRIGVNPGMGITEDKFASLKANDLQIKVRVGSINPSLQQKLNAGTQVPEENYGFHLDGLKTMVLQNELGIMPADQPFDPFTPYPFPNKSFYIGSDEVFNKNLSALAINIQKTIDPPLNSANEQIAFISKFVAANQSEYRVNDLIKKEFVPLWHPLGEGTSFEFTRYDLTLDILGFITNKLTGSVDGNPQRDSREPIEFNKKWSRPVNKGFLRLDNTIPLGVNSTKSPSELSQALAPSLQVKEISLNYVSELNYLDSAIDQFFHVYPFGVVETFISYDGLGKPLNTPPFPADFKTLDAQKNFQLVDANNLLLPQFNFLSPYQEFNKKAGKLNAITVGSKRGLRLNAATTDAELKSAIIGKRTDVTSLLRGAARLSDQTSGFNQYSKGEMQEGMLQLGLENCKPLQSVSILFQFAEGSAENEDDDPPPINWSYLANNEWRPLKAEHIVSDSTYGFQTTGIVKINTPADASTRHTGFPDGLIWFCASVSKNSERIPQLIDVVTQAVAVAFRDNDNDQSHFNNALPAGSIAEMQNPAAAIASVQQPFASFDGKHKEIGKEFYTRVSERLRHKGRAITAWDYEHLVLDRFPGIYKVKCITHTDPNCHCRTSLVKPAATVGVNTFPKQIIFDVGNITNVKTLVEQLGKFLKDNPAADIVLSASENIGLAKIGLLISYLSTSAGIVFETGQTEPMINPTPIGASRVGWRVTPVIGRQKFEPGTAVGIAIKPADCCGPQVAPGHVLVVPVSNLKNRNSINPLQPKTGRRTLLAIQDYLSKLSSPFVHVHAKNPNYEEVIVSFKVKFNNGVDKGYYMKQLNVEIVRFLTPWAFDENADVLFTQKIYASSVINFIEERSYVDFITEFVMGLCCDTCCPEPASTGNFGSVKGTVKNQKGEGMGGVLVKIKDLNISTTTAPSTILDPVTQLPIVTKGDYHFNGVPAGGHNMVAYFSIFSTVKTDFTIEDIQGNEQIVNIKHADQTINTGCGCNELEFILENDPQFKGDIVAKPCSSHSILVSVPHHIIIPYEDPDPPSPCDPALTATRGKSFDPGNLMDAEASTADSGGSGKVNPKPKRPVKDIKSERKPKQPAVVKHPKKKND